MNTGTEEYYLEKKRLRGRFTFLIKLLTKQVTCDG